MENAVLIAEFWSDGDKAGEPGCEAVSLCTQARRLTSLTAGPRLNIRKDVFS